MTREGYSYFVRSPRADAELVEDSKQPLNVFHALGVERSEAEFTSVQSNCCSSLQLCDVNPVCRAAMGVHADRFRSSMSFMQRAALCSWYLPSCYLGPVPRDPWLSSPLGQPVLLRTCWLSPWRFRPDRAEPPVRSSFGPLHPLEGALPGAPFAARVQLQRSRQDFLLCRGKSLSGDKKSLLSVRSPSSAVAQARRAVVSLLQGQGYPQPRVFLDLPVCAG